MGPVAHPLPRRRQELAPARQGVPREVLHVTRPQPGPIHAAAIARRRAAFRPHQVRRAAHGDAAGHEDGHVTLHQGAGRGRLQDGLGRVLQAFVPHGGAVPGLGRPPCRRRDLRRPGTLQRVPQQFVCRQSQHVQATHRSDTGLGAAALQGRAPAQRTGHHQDRHRHGPTLPQGQVGRTNYCPREQRELREMRPQSVPAFGLRRSVRQDPRSDVRRLAPHYPQQHALVQRATEAAGGRRDQAGGRQAEAGRLRCRGLLPEAHRGLRDALSISMTTIMTHGNN
ncbi:hypothetical protein FOCC_FOCC012719 [Frankliniella occidentalis]|nr:hypothetical protein FOCC_FOCC012719 [Frankliniella occidentalis]